MAFPALAFLAPAGKFLAGLLARKAVQGAVMNAARSAAMQGSRSFLAGQAARGAIGTGARFAAGGLSKGGRMLVGDLAAPNAKWHLGARLVPDAIGGTVAGFVTPGTWDQKLAAGITTAALPAAAGLGAARLGSIGKAVGPLSTKRQLLSDALDFGASIGTDFTVAPMASDSIARGLDKIRGGLGESGWEKMSREQQALLEQQILQAYGLIPGARLPYTGMA